MTWRLDINHVTRYQYDRPVVASYNEARMTPLSIPGQLVIDAQVTVHPTWPTCFATGTTGAR